MEYTENLNLKKPEQDDYYDIENENDNMDILDEEVGNKQDCIKATIDPDISTLEKASEYFGKLIYNSTQRKQKFMRYTPKFREWVEMTSPNTRTGTTEERLALTYGDTEKAYIYFYDTDESLWYEGFALTEESATYEWYRNFIADYETLPTCEEFIREHPEHYKCAVGTYLYQIHSEGEDVFEWIPLDEKYIKQNEKITDIQPVDELPENPNATTLYLIKDS